MFSISVREENSKVDKIIYGCNYSEYVYDYDSKIIQINDEMDSVMIYKSDIDYLIKALQKAKELWT